MKKLLLFILSLITINLSSQINFKWEKIDSVAKNKTQIYSDTKLFISETWKSSQNVIQNDDRDGGIILIKGMTKQSCGNTLSALSFWYSYTVKFLMKDGKYKLIIENIRYESGPTEAWSQKELNPQDIYPGLWKAGVYEKAWTQIMTSLKTNMQNIVDSYDKSIKSTSLNSGW